MDGKYVFSEEIICPYCNNVAPMKELNRTAVKEQFVESPHPSAPDMTNSLYWQILECPACRKHLLREGWYNDYFYEEGISYKIIFPLSGNKEYDLPEKIKKAYTSAQKVKHIDSNAFAVLLGRLLDQICEDKKAEGANLYEKIKNLAARQIIPETVAQLALGLKDIRNIGAHANLGDLSPEQIPIIEEITEIILDFVYKSPVLIEKIRKQITDLKGKKKDA